MSIVAAADAFSAHLEQMRKAPTAPQGLPTGIPDLDRLLGGGLGDGEVTTVFARTSIGKSSLILDMIQGFCEHLLDARDARTVAFVSAEMPGRAIVQRLTAMNLNIPRDKLRFADPKQITDFLAYLKTWPLAILDQRAPDLGQVEAWLVAESGGWAPKKGRPPYAAIVVDHLGKLQIPGVYEIYPKTSKLADATFAMAGYYQCPLVQAAQVNREVEKRISRNRDGTIDVGMTRPMPSDVEGSGKVEQNSDVMIGVWREEHYMAMHEQRRENAGPIECTVVKNRAGPLGPVVGTFDPELTKISWPGRGSRRTSPPTKASALTTVKAALRAASAEEAAS